MKSVRKERTFKKPEVLRLMLTLRSEGWPLEDLGVLFDCDKTSIRKACLRNGLPPEIRLIPHPLIIFRRVYIDYNGERLNQGKSYRELLEESRKRQLMMRLRGARI